MDELEQKLQDTNGYNEMLEQKFGEGEKVRAELNKKILQYKGNLRVYCRVRPVQEDIKNIPQEQCESNSLKNKAILEYGNINQQEIKIRNPSKNIKSESYFFDKVFKPDSTQIDVFSEL